MKDRVIITVSIWLIILLVVGVFLYQMFSYWLVDTSVPIDGFSDELVEYIKDDYGFTIPKDAKFISGQNKVESKSDNWIVIYFEYPLDLDEISDENVETYVIKELKLDSKHYENAKKATPPALEDDNTGFEWEFVSKKHPKTTLAYMVEEDRLVICFTGYKPTKWTASQKAKYHR